MAILVVYYHRYTYPMRRSLEDHIYSLERYGKRPCCFLNAAFGVPDWVLQQKYELVIFQTTLLAHLRWREGAYEQLIGRLRCLKQIDAPKAIIPQDEFLRSDIICRLIEDFDVQYLFSCAVPSEWQKIYRDVDIANLSCTQLLTGYLSNHVLEDIQELEKDCLDRDICIGYRAWHAEHWLGRHGALKTKVAEVFQNVDPSFDISTKPEDTFLGMDWYRFLLRCKYTIGCEGGSSILDYDGSVRKRVGAYMELNPNASFEATESACFEGLDGSLDLKAISPRHLEACATKTCQILVEGEYNGILKPNIHYIPLKADFSNLDEVLTKVRRDNLREEMVDRAYRDIVESGRYTYASMIDAILEAALAEDKSANCVDLAPFKKRENRLWYLLRLEANIWQTAKGLLPDPLLDLLRQFKPV